MQGLMMGAAAVLGVATSLTAFALASARVALDRAPSRKSRRTGRDGLLVLGTTALGDSVRISPDRLVPGLSIEGPDAARRAMFSSLMAQASAQGLGYLMLSGGISDTYGEAARAEAVCHPSRLTVLDTLADTDGTHTMSFLSDLPAESVIRIILACCPGFGAGGPVAVKARALLESLVRALVHLRDEGLCSGTPDLLIEHLEFSRFVHLGDAEFYPSLPPSARQAVEAYLESLPGYSRSRLYKQPPGTLETHDQAAAIIEEGLGWLRGKQFETCFTGRPDISAADLLAPGRQVVVRVAHGAGERQALRFFVACLTEALRCRPKDAGAGMPFIVMVDGLDEMPPEVAEAVAGFGSVGLVVGTREATAHRHDAAVHVLTRCATGIVLNPVPGRPATLTSAAARMRFRPLSWSPRAALAPVERRVVLNRPSRQELKDAMNLPFVLSRLVDPDLPEELVERERESKATLRHRADAGDLIALASLYLSDLPGQMKVDTGTAIGVLALKAGASIPSHGFPPQPSRPSPPPAPPKPEPEDLDLDFGTFDFDPLAGLDAPLAPEPPAVAPIARRTAVVVPASLADDPFLKEKAWKNLVGRPLPLVGLSRQDGARETLVGEFPHLAPQIDRILSDASSRDSIRLRPILFHGAPGAGKTRFARRLGEVLGLGALIYNCGGASDASFGGTSRQWTSGRPSVPMQTIRRLMVANPCIILDEIEKTGDGRHNGNLTDLLLGLTERETSSRSFDLYLEAEVDLSNVVWLAVANTLSGLHPPFVQRFRLVEIGLPGLDHADIHVRSMVRSVNEDRGILPIWAFDPSDAEVDMMAEIWGGGSFRRLRSVVERTIDSLDAIDRKRLN